MANSVEWKPILAFINQITFSQKGVDSVVRKILLIGLNYPGRTNIWSILKGRTLFVNFRDWCDLCKFPRFWEFTCSHAIIDEIGKPSWDNATDCFKNLNGMSWRELSDYISRFLMRTWIAFASAGTRNSDFFKFVCLRKCVGSNGY